MKNFKQRLLPALFFFFTFVAALKGQKDTVYQGVSGIYFLDSVVVSATRSGLNLEDFISLAQEDNTFYRAFKNIRFLNYVSENSVIFYDLDGNRIAGHKSEIQQHSDGRCRTMQFAKKDESQGYRDKDGKPVYYTAQLFERLFFTEGRQCAEKMESSPAEQKASGMEKHISELKKLIFQPGQEADVPLIGKKMAIFSPAMAPYYQLKIRSDYFEGKPCYVLSASATQAEKNQNETVVKFMETYFEKGTFQVLGRNYHLQYANWVFDFDVKFRIVLQQLNQQYVPLEIKYLGVWNIPAKKPEVTRFSARFYDFLSP